MVGDLCGLHAFMRIGKKLTVDDLMWLSDYSDNFFTDIEVMISCSCFRGSPLVYLAALFFKCPLPRTT